MLGPLRDAGFDVLARNHAEAILAHDFATETAELFDALTRYRISLAELVSGGGGESGQTQRLRRTLADRDWAKHKFSVQTIVDGQEREAVSHEVDHVRFGPAGTLALEIEWNNKDPFFDRDLENFQRLHAMSAISVGIIVTRGSSMQEVLFDRVRDWLDGQGLREEADLERLGIGTRTAAQRRNVATQVARGVPFGEAFSRNFVTSKFGIATTHWAKLEDRVRRGVGNPCPLLLIGLPESILDG
ncbi:BglII/BstYI family type II restriction endonuclease [Pelagovum pacificum]|uniref:Restriction endonuclease n=1 Tax=Pelagovum pacificum TaxID=2588711 RepID=A0A5C5GGN9_9RHOB|nr:BglII/BstYI family type II restriction endonuclease [Pelagovum pacificum]QQA43768.1 restriction endonuclease [Pelagovum pacificum]TNY33101.1 restriction endonuclease [Pelagovum pacificum]